MKYEITKGSEKDFEQAPEWATKVLRDNNDSKKSFVGELGGITLVAEAVSSHSWWKYNDGYVGSLIAERRPITEPVWLVGELPPAGTQVDIISDVGDSIVFEGSLTGEVIAHVEDNAVVRMSWGLACFKADRLRPIRSPEDVARDEGKEVIAKSLRSSKDYDEAAGVIYEAIAAGRIKGLIKEPSTADLKIQITTDEMWREFEKKSDMEDVYKLITKRMGGKLCGF